MFFFLLILVVCYCQNRFFFHKPVDRHLNLYLLQRLLRKTHNFCLFKYFFLKQLPRFQTRRNLIRSVYIPASFGRPKLARRPFQIVWCWLFLQSKRTLYAARVSTSRTKKCKHSNQQFFSLFFDSALISKSEWVSEWRRRSLLFPEIESLRFVVLLLLYSKHCLQ